MNTKVVIFTSSSSNHCLCSKHKSCLLKCKVASSKKSWWIVSRLGCPRETKKIKSKRRHHRGTLMHQHWLQKEHKSGLLFYNLLTEILFENSMLAHVMFLFMYMSNWRKIFWKTSQLWWWRWIIHIISYKNKVKVQWSFLTESTNYPSNSEQDFHAIISNDDLMNDATFAFINANTHF